jgi:hypothetical protein
MRARLYRNQLAIGNPKTWDQTKKEAEKRAVADAEQPKNESWFRWLWPKPKPSVKPKPARISENPATLLTRESKLMWALRRQKAALNAVNNIHPGLSAEEIDNANVLLRYHDAEVLHLEELSRRYW